MSTSGHCLCGAVVVKVQGAISDFPTLMCHCGNCKRRSGGVASYAFCVPKEKVESITGDSHKIYEDNDTASGHTMQRSMCGTCGSPVMIIEHSQPDTRCLQYGLFADQELPPPKLEFFWGQACQWEKKVGEDVREKE